MSTSSQRDAPTRRIGITGHSDLTVSSLPHVSAALREWLTPRNGTWWVGVSCLARGADQLFAALVLELGGQLEVILPAHDYRSRKVEPDNAAQFDRLLAAAARVTVMDFEQSCRVAYMSASTALLAAVDTVIAVWDGQPARRHGSTGDVVIAARQLELPVTVLWPRCAARCAPATTGSAGADVPDGEDLPATKARLGY
ncbi:MAG: hypothetical protein L0I76_09810 [Pseudonocardia sp.]|nr:hypothetical protein [Pseudonocardia sp.]